VKIAFGSFSFSTLGTWTGLFHSFFQLIETWALEGGEGLWRFIFRQNQPVFDDQKIISVKLVISSNSIKKFCTKRLPLIYCKEEAY